jgi:Fe-S cluster assembly iron-binding protein IscA
LGLALDEPNEKETIKADGIDILVTEDTRGYAESSLVDYTSSIYGEGFTIHTGYACS